MDNSLGGYIVDKDKMMVLDVPDLTGFKVRRVSILLILVAQAICCLFDS